METLSKQADEAQTLRDQVDDLRHVADKLEKTERTVDMLKKKAEEANDLRRQLKACADHHWLCLRMNGKLICPVPARSCPIMRLQALQAELEAERAAAAELEDANRSSSRQLNVADTYKRQISGTSAIALAGQVQVIFP